MTLIPQSQKHGPNLFRAYFQAHNGKLKELEGAGLVIRNNLSTDPKFPYKKTPYMKIEGHLELAGGLRVDVRKTLKVQHLPATGEFHVYTIKYSYSLIKDGSHPIFRYCSSHDDDPDTPEHHKHHHKHSFEPSTGKQLDVSILDEDQWPTLGEVLDEAQRYGTD